MSERLRVFRAALPIILANSSAPLLGLVDTALMGHWGGEKQLAAIAVGTMLFNFLYWSFGFLRMSTTGFTAQAYGRGDNEELSFIFSRALIVAAGLSVVLLAGQAAWQYLGLSALGAEGEVREFAGSYFRARIWGAPATLVGYVATGILVGRGETSKVLWVQLLLNGSNALLDFFFVRGLQLGPFGLGLGFLLYCGGLSVISHPITS